MEQNEKSLYNWSKKNVSSFNKNKLLIKTSQVFLGMYYQD